MFLYVIFEEISDFTLADIFWYGENWFVVWCFNVDLSGT